MAVHSETRGWTVEAAIPLTALTGDRVTPGRAWACNVVRVLPGRGVQAWSLPAEAPEEALRPEGMGLLLFTGGTGADTAGQRGAADAEGEVTNGSRSRLAGSPFTPASRPVYAPDLVPCEDLRDKPERRSPGQAGRPRVRGPGHSRSLHPRAVLSLQHGGERDIVNR